MKSIDCRCGQVLGIQNDDGSIESRHKGRVTHFWPPGRITCQKCHFTKAVDKEREPVVS